ncbi:MAG TPA: response regulator [Pirellulales bacterium]|nr:response regulator [Pirellulales bacterium]
MDKKVLMCDDEAHILRAAQIKLSHAGYNVTTAADGQEAWEAIVANPPDILVTDLQMPRMDGMELSRRVRENPATAQLPIVMLTAKGFELAHLELAEKCGVLAVLPKPFSPRELVRYLDSVLAEGGSTAATTGAGATAGN